MAERRRGLTANEATPVAKPVAKPKAPTSKPKSQAVAARPWWWYATPAGIANEIKYRQKQQARINKGYTPVAGTKGIFYRGPDGKLTFGRPTDRDAVLGAAKIPVNVGLLAINAGQRLSNGNKPADPAATPVGRALTGGHRALTSALGMPQVEQRKPEDLFWQDIGEQVTAGVIGGLGASAVVKATAFTGGAAANLAPWAQRALRWTAGVGTESFIATPLTNNTTGNVANAFGGNAPMAVQPTDDPLSATGKSFLPNAFAEIAAAGLFLGMGEGLGAIGRQAKAAREVGEAANARDWTVKNGFQTEADGDFDFTPPPAAAAPEPTAAATPAAAPAPAASTAADAAPAATPEPAAPTSLKEAENQLLGPDDADVDEAPVYDANLPEIDLPVRALERLDDERLVAAASGEGPVLPEIERQLQDQQATFQVEEGLGLERTAAPTQNLANPTVPYEAQWQQLPHNTLISLASPANNPQLFDKIHLMTGRSFEELTRVDVIDGLKALREEGTTVLPDRVMNGSGMSKTSELSVNAPLFQYKDNVNAQGQQKGNSLEGVTKWNPDLEQVNLVWDNPADGQTYMINGHNSLAKAKELGIPTIPTKRILANTPGEARLIGAKANIASGGGTAFDAAKIIRELGIQDAAGLEAAGIPLDSGLGTSGLALSKLPDDLFQQAINGELGMGRALALGGSGLDPADMIRVAGLGGKKEISERGFAELVQMASSAPKVADADQGGIPGMDEWLKDSSVIEKAELSAKVRADLINSKNLFGKVSSKKSSQKLADKGGTQVNQEQVASAADIAKAVLSEFDRDKYLAGTPISELLNQGAADIAAGGKPAVIAKRILQQLETAAEQAPPVVPEASVPSAGTPEPELQQGLLPAQREELKKAAIQKAIANGEVRPSEAPLPEVPEGPRDLTNAQATLEDELRLAEHYGAEDAIRQQVEMEAARAQMGWDRMTLDEKKANGMLDTWKDTRGEGKYFHGAAGEISLREGGEWEGDGMNIYGDGFYATDDLTTAKKYQKKNKGRGQDANGVTYEVTEKGPVKFFDLNKPASEEVLDKLRGAAGYDSMRELVDTAIDQFESGKATLADVMDEMRNFSREFEIPAHEIQGTWQELIFDLQNDGYGGFTHQGGTLAGKGKRLHQVRIYWDPANSIDLNRVDGAGPAAAPAPAIEIPEAAGRKITAKTSEMRIEFAAKSLLEWINSGVPGQKQAITSLDQALALVRAKGAILDPDAIPGLNVDLARNDRAMGRSTEVTKGVAAAYGQFYGLKDELSSIADEGMLQEMDSGPIRGLSRQAQAKQAIQDVAKEAIERITGGELSEISFEDVYKRHITPLEHGGDGIKQSMQAGYYQPVNDAIKVRGLLESPPSDVMESVYHESFHRVQYTLLSQKDMEVFDSVFGKARIDDMAALRNSRTKATIEKQAYAFQVYAAAKAKGMDLMPEQYRMEVVNMLDTEFPRKNGESWGGTLRGEAVVKIFQAWDRVLEYLERLNNAARFRGFTSVEDLFNKAYSGELAKSRALDFAVELITPDQVKRFETLERWTTDNRVAVAEITQATVSIDIQINALKAQAMSGGC